MIKFKNVFKRLLVHNLILDLNVDLAGYFLKKYLKIIDNLD